ncbi:hypothetical protein I6G97_14670 [Edwardsiella hoshinae]|uniref:Uncharacterized protein n=1 Tax=Edwardsiella hoshinae TaxID=93378 RepID=A0A376DBJ3_9GAMM|nr:hypothetical protein [Edwardsiella hoshinae]QPR29867.1 hypothetical protein I6G97_14670 [Edwardsiella hoshinae]STC86583.1 Uncharacterised protein [Edwardsiella hoshinae]
MSSNDNNEQTGDEELAPMVDGLSGALCIFILITTVFMISGIDSVVTGIGRAYTGQASRVDYLNNTVYFVSVLSLSQEEYARINDGIRRSTKKNIIIEASDPAINSSAATRVKRDLTYNLLEFKKYLNLNNMRVTLKIANDDFCKTRSSCIKWSVN